MATTTKFEIMCPNNHGQMVTFSRDEFEAKLSAGAIRFHCNTCDTDWQPSGKDIAQFRREFEKTERERS